MPSSAADESSANHTGQPLGESQCQQHAARSFHGHRWFGAKKSMRDLPTFGRPLKNVTRLASAAKRSAANGNASVQALNPHADG
jgi:hypothetical protein